MSDLKSVSVRTSLSHPLRIDEVVIATAAAAAAGRIGLCICPGKRGDSVMGGPWQRDLERDLEVVRRWMPHAVLTLIEAHEFQLLGDCNLGSRLRALGIEWHHLPIVDRQAPDARFEAAWAVCGPRVQSCLRSGGRILVHCRGGLGRAGTVAARLLVELDMPAADAVAQVRRARPGAIETDEQWQHVINLPRRQDGPRVPSVPGALAGAA